MTGSSYKAPEVSGKQVTPTFVRDELLKCFESANKEFMQVVHQPTTDEALRAQVRQFVTTVFQGCGVSFDNPTKTGIVTAIDQCKVNAEAMMGPAGADIIRHHYSEMMKLVDELPESR
jgi:hypothetical protein